VIFDPSGIYTLNEMNVDHVAHLFESARLKGGAMRRNDRASP
jgi:hypothetical protein